MADDACSYEYFLAHAYFTPSISVGDSIETVVNSDNSGGGEKQTPSGDSLKTPLSIVRRTTRSSSNSLIKAKELLTSARKLQQVMKQTGSSQQRRLSSKVKLQLRFSRRVKTIFITPLPDKKRGIVRMPVSPPTEVNGDGGSTNESVPMVVSLDDASTLVANQRKYRRRSANYSQLQYLDEWLLNSEHELDPSEPVEVPHGSGPSSEFSSDVSVTANPSLTSSRSRRRSFLTASNNITKLLAEPFHLQTKREQNYPFIVSPSLNTSKNSRRESKLPSASPCSKKTVQQNLFPIFSPRNQNVQQTLPPEKEHKKATQKGTSKKPPASRTGKTGRRSQSVVVDLEAESELTNSECKENNKVSGVESAVIRQYPRSKFFENNLLFINDQQLYDGLKRLASVHVNQADDRLSSICQSPLTTVALLSKRLRKNKNFANVCELFANITLAFELFCHKNQPNMEKPSPEACDETKDNSLHKEAAHSEQLERALVKRYISLFADTPVPESTTETCPEAPTTSDTKNVLWTERLKAVSFADHVASCQSVAQEFWAWMKRCRNELTKGNKSKAASRSKAEKRKKRRNSGSSCSDTDYEEASFCGCPALISGPSGSGKTSLVYTCAEQLGFRVIEINCSMERSHSAVLSCVDGALKNHRLSTSARTGMMDPFARMQSATQATNLTSSENLPNAKRPKLLRQQTVLEPQPNSFSLLLFDDVDVVFGQDEGFWTALKGVAENSCIPIVLTCAVNDRTSWTKNRCLGCSLYQESSLFNDFESVNSRFQETTTMKFQEFVLHNTPSESLRMHLRAICSARTLNLAKPVEEKLLSMFPDIRLLINQLQFLLESCDIENSADNLSLFGSSNHGSICRTENCDRVPENDSLGSLFKLSRQADVLVASDLLSTTGCLYTSAVSDYAWTVVRIADGLNDRMPNACCRHSSSNIYDSSLMLNSNCDLHSSSAMASTSSAFSKTCAVGLFPSTCQLNTGIFSNDYFPTLRRIAQFDAANRAIKGTRYRPYFNKIADRNLRTTFEAKCFDAKDL